MKGAQHVYSNRPKDNFLVAFPISAWLGQVCNGRMGSGDVACSGNRCSVRQHSKASPAARGGCFC